MTRKLIDFDDFQTAPMSLFDQQWMLLTCGDFAKQHFNCMPIAWGFMGTLWNKPIFQMFVRSTRFTYEFMEQYDSFTVCAFPEKYRKALKILGAKSGRNSNKLEQSGLTPIAVKGSTAPGYDEAELIVACRKVYWQDMVPDHFLAPEIDKCYPKQHYHRFYFGEVVTILGEDKYSRE